MGTGARAGSCASPAADTLARVSGGRGPLLPHLVAAAARSGRWLRVPELPQTRPNGLPKREDHGTRRFNLV